jgi:hypothetical protein
MNSQEGLMKKCAVYVLLVVMFSQVTWAQAPPEGGPDWAAVTSLKSGSSVKVDFKDGKTWNGKLNSVTDENIFITRNKALAEITRPEIGKLYRTQGSIGNSAALGGLIGAGSGATLGYIAGDSCNGSQFCLFSKGEMAAGGALVGAGLGVVIGLVIGAVRRKKTVVYEAR